MKFVVDELPKGCYFCNLFYSYKYHYSIFNKIEKICAGCKLLGELHIFNDKNEPLVDIVNSRYEKCPITSIKSITFGG